MRRWIKISLAVIAITGVLVLGGAYYLLSRLDPLARDWVRQALAEKFRSNVEIDSINVTLRPEPVAVAYGITLRHKGRTDVPPLLAIHKLVVRTSYAALRAQVKRVHLVEFHGLTIKISRKRADAPSPAAPPSEQRKTMPKFEIENIVADGTQLMILPRDPAKDPLEFDIKKLKLRSVAPDQPMKFDATLLNAQPPGDIISSGTFGPWNGEDPGQTPLQGDYSFRNADLSVFNGIAGILSSDGKYSGVLERIDAEGTTDTPDFRLGDRGHRVPLRTRFHAIVDGTNGNTTLDPVEATLGTTQILCRGSVTGTKAVKGKTIDMATTITRGRVEDLLNLTVRAKKPLMTGLIRMNAKLLIPPGDRDVIEKLRLRGRFNMDRVTFTSPEIQDKIDNMSKKARGKPKEEIEGDVAAHFDGLFQLANGKIVLDALTFEIPGATVLLKGDYGIRSEQIDMAGQLRMQARVSQTQTGWKSLVLKAVDPFFAKEGVGAVIPFRIGGTRENPQFALQLRGGKKESSRTRKN